MPILPPNIGSATAVQIVFNPAVASTNVVIYCAQLGTIGNNHELGINYLPYTQQPANCGAEVALVSSIR